MHSVQGQYALVRYCPDASRQEFVNIGVALYSPDTKRVSALLSRDNRRLTQVFGRQDLHLVNRLKRSLEENLRRESFASVSDLQNYVDRTANAVRLGPLRPMKISNVQEDLKALFTRLVDEAPHRRRRIDRAFGERLLESGVDSYVQKAVSIEIPSVEQSIRVPYAYKNGRYNLITPVEFTSDGRGVLSRAGEKAIEGQILYKQEDAEHGPMHLVVVAKFGDDVPSVAREVVAEIFEKHNVGLYTFENLDPLMDNIREAAIEHGLLISEP